MKEAMVAMIPKGIMTIGTRALSSLAGTVNAIPATRPMIARLMPRSGKRRKLGVLTSATVVMARADPER
jgi:hypothetical protein